MHACCLFSFEMCLGGCSRSCGVSHPSDSGGKGAGEDEGLDALLQPWNVHDLQEVALHRAQQSGVRDPFVLGVGPLQQTVVMVQQTRQVPRCPST